MSSAVPGGRSEEQRPRNGPVAEPAPVVPRWLARGAAISWRIIVVAAAFALIAWLAARLLLILLPMVAATFASTLLAPPAAWLRRHGWPPLAATWVVVLGALALLGGTLALLVPPVASQLSHLSVLLGDAFGRIKTWLIGGPLHLSSKQVRQLTDQFRHPIASSGLLSGALYGVRIAVEIVATTILTIVLTFFFVKDGRALIDWMLGFARVDRAERLSGAFELSWEILTAYILGAAVNGGVNGTLLGVGLFAIGVPLALPLAAITFLGGFFPLVGGIVSGALAALVALATRGVTAALIVVGFTIAIHHVEGYLVGPLVLGRAVRLHTVAVIITLSIGTILGGIPGAFVAVPIAAIVLSLIEYYRRPPSELVVATNHGPARGLQIVNLRRTDRQGLGLRSALTGRRHPATTQPPQAKD